MTEQTTEWVWLVDAAAELGMTPPDLRAVWQGLRLPVRRIKDESGWCVRASDIERVKRLMDEATA